MAVRMRGQGSAIWVWNRFVKKGGRRKKIGWFLIWIIHRYWVAYWIQDKKGKWWRL